MNWLKEIKEYFESSYIPEILKDEETAVTAKAGKVAKKSKGKKKGGASTAIAAESEDDLDTMLAEQAAKDAVMKAEAERKELREITLRLAEDQQRMARNWEADLAIHRDSLSRHHKKVSSDAATSSHTPALKEWVKDIIEQENLLFSRCQEQLRHHFGLYGRSGSRWGVIDATSGAVGFFHTLHPEDKYKDKSAYWRKALKDFFERAGIYGD